MGQCFPSRKALTHPFPMLITNPAQTERIGPLVLHTWYLWHDLTPAQLISIDHNTRQVKFIIENNAEVTFSFDHLPKLKPLTQLLHNSNLAQHPSNLVARISGTPCSIYLPSRGWLPARVGKVYPDVFELSIGVDNQSFILWVPLYINIIRPREALHEKLECKICLQAEITQSFKCGHVACQACAQKLHRCHLCRRPITERRPLFL